MSDEIKRNLHSTDVNSLLLLLMTFDCSMKRNHFILFQAISFHCVFFRIFTENQIPHYLLIMLEGNSTCLF